MARFEPGHGLAVSPVALGLQQRSRTAVFAALAPIALGHALAIGLVVFVVYVIGAVIPFRWLQIGCAATLFGIACWKLYRLRHPTWVGMCVNFWDLTLWSWLMASAHGAGLMVVPVLLGSKIAFLRNRVLRQPERHPDDSTAHCDRRGRRAYAFAFVGLRIDRLDSLRFHRFGDPAPFMDQS